MGYYKDSSAVLQRRGSPEQKTSDIDMATRAQTGKGVSLNDTVEMPESSQAKHQFGYLESDNVATQEDIPPDGGYGWVVTACVFIINAHTWGINSVSPDRIPCIVETDT